MPTRVIPSSNVLAKHDLVLGGITLVGKHRRQTFLVVGHQVYTHLRRDFGPLLFADPLQILKVAWQHEASAPSTDFLWI